MCIGIYACYLKDKTELSNSSSGGVFTALTNSILNLNGVVIACSYNYEDNTLEFEKASTQEQRNKMRGSKYIQAKPEKMYKLLKEQLSTGEKKPIIVVGTPCQIAGVKAYYQTINDVNREVYFCDLICHGVSSPNMWKQYIRDIENNNESNIQFLTFKDKEKGWVRPTAKVLLENGTYVSAEDYAKLYRSDDFMRPSCYDCRFSNINRMGDLTIGDFWNYKSLNEDFRNMQGMSLILLNTEKGKNLFEKSLSQLNYCNSTINDCMQLNLESPTRKTKRYKYIQKDYKNKGLDYIIMKYVHYGPGFSVVRRLRRKIHRWKYN